MMKREIENVKKNQMKFSEFKYRIPEMKKQINIGRNYQQIIPQK